MELAGKNAALVLSTDKERLKREEGRTIGAVKELEKMLGLRGILRMEAFDISNTSGFASVGSMVVYERGKPKRNDYRKFKIKGVQGADDYASMEEVLTRRFEHGMREQEEGKDIGGFTAFPDLILMDGGKGQVNVALRVLDQLTRIQDEAHRFAITFHRQLRGKGQVHSILDDIKGVGPARRKDLMRHFENIDAIRNATVEQLKELPSMNEKSAQDVYDFFH